MYTIIANSCFVPKKGIHAFMYYMVIFIELPPGSVYIISQVKLTGLIRPGILRVTQIKYFIHSYTGDP